MAKSVKAERREKKRRRVVANQKRGGTVAGQLKKIEISLGYRRRKK
jgi:hypothetical protein